MSIVSGRSTPDRSLEDAMRQDGPSPKMKGDLMANGFEPLSQLDDMEFSIPKCEDIPTLEEILNEPDDDEVSLGSSEETGTSVGEQKAMFSPESPESQSVASLGSMRGSLSSSKCSASLQRARQERSARRDTGILRHVILKGVSAQLNSAATNADIGSPTAIAVSALLAIGTSHGMTLVFDSSQALKWALGSALTRDEFGPVSCMSFNQDCSRLLVGFSKGQVTMYDLSNGKILRTITDAHSPSTAVLHVKFTDLHTLAIISDSGGSVFELNFRRQFGVRGCESRCLFSGARGEVIAIEPLLLSNSGVSPRQELSILAMATVSRAIVVAVRPELEVLFAHPLGGESKNVPLLSWQFVVIQMADSSRVVDPVLCFARNSTLYFFQMTLCSRDILTFQLLQRVQLQYPVMDVRWLNSRTLVTLDTLELLHILDVRSLEELEVCDISNVELVYGTSHFKGLATGGNVSRAMAVLAEHACYNSLCTSGMQILLLGTQALHVLVVRSWSERMDYFVRQGRYKDALSFGIDLLEDKAKAIVGLPARKDKRRTVVITKMLGILDQYLNDTLLNQSMKQKNGKNLTNLYLDVVPACTEYCLHIDQRDMLFGKMYDAVNVDTMAKDIYLDALEPYILNDQLKVIPPQITQDLVSHFEQKKRFEALEACLLHLSISCLDLHQVISTCWAHNLHDALLSIYNRGMLDFISPFEDLINILYNALEAKQALSTDQIRLGNKLLVYLSCCLAGRAYPFGDIPSDQVSTVKYQVFSCLTSIHSKNATETESSYPYLRTLLHFDTLAFLNVLSLAFEESEFQTELGGRQRQRVIDILLMIMLQPAAGFSASQVGTLFVFLARELSRPRGMGGIGVTVSRDLFDQVLEHLTSPPPSGEGSREHEERQQALLELILAGGLTHYNSNRLLALVEKARFFRVCEVLYEQREDYDKILSCYLRDPARETQTFSYIMQVVQRARTTGQDEVEKRMAHQTLTAIQDLVKISGTKTAQLIAKIFPHLLVPVVENLQESPEALFAVLQEVFQIRDLQAQNTPQKVAGRSESIMEELETHPSLYETYLDLLCRFQPMQVSSYLKNHEGYHLESILEICQRHNNVEAVAFLLEKSGDMQGAVNLLQDRLRAKLNELSDHDKEAGGDCDLFFSQLEGMVVVLVQLCQRSSAHLKPKDKEQLWFPVLETLLYPQGNLQSSLSPVSLTQLKGVTQHMISSMLGYVPMPAVVKRIISDPAYCSRQFGELRELINGVLEAYNYEEVLLSCTLNLLHLETHKSHIEYVGDQNKGHPSGLQLLCSSCAQPLKGNFIFFRCGHKYHRECCKKDRMDWVCKFCFFKGSPNASEFSPVRHEGRGPSPLLDESGPNDQKYEEFLNALRQRRRLDSDSQMVLVSLMDCCSTSTSGSTQSDPDAVGSSWAPHLQVAAPRPFRFKSEF